MKGTGPGARSRFFNVWAKRRPKPVWLHSGGVNVPDIRGLNGLDVFCRDHGGGHFRHWPGPI